MTDIIVLKNTTRSELYEPEVTIFFNHEYQYSIYYDDYIRGMYVHVNPGTRAKLFDLVEDYFQKFNESMYYLMVDT